MAKRAPRRSRIRFTPPLQESVNAELATQAGRPDDYATAQALLAEHDQLKADYAQIKEIPHDDPRFGVYAERLIAHGHRLVGYAQRAMGASRD